MLGDAPRIGKQAVDGNESLQRRKDREDAVVGHAGRQRQEVIPDIAVNAK
jgi:hypothetical protein